MIDGRQTNNRNRANRTALQNSGTPFAPIQNIPSVMYSGAGQDIVASSEERRMSNPSSARADQDIVASSEERRMSTTGRNYDEFVSKAEEYQETIDNLRTLPTERQISAIENLADETRQEYSEATAHLSPVQKAQLDDLYLENDIIEKASESGNNLSREEAIAARRFIESLPQQTTPTSTAEQLSQIPTTNPTPLTTEQFNQTVQQMSPSEKAQLDHLFKENTIIAHAGLDPNDPNSRATANQINTLIDKAGLDHTNAEHVRQAKDLHVFLGGQVASSPQTSSIPPLNIPNVLDRPNGN